MKLFLVLLVVASLTNIAKTQSLDEVLSGCEISKSPVYGYDLRCNDYQNSYLPYTEEFKEATLVAINGNFSEMVIDPKYVKLYYLDVSSSNLQNFQLQDYTTFTEITQIIVYGSKHELNVNFTGVEELPSLTYMNFAGYLLSFSCANVKSSNPTLFDDVNLRLDIYSSNIERFDFNCLPSTLSVLRVSSSNISSFASFDSLRNLSHLTAVTFAGNSINIKRFNFDYLPKIIQVFNFYENGISEMEGYDSLRNLLSLRSLSLDRNNLIYFNTSCIPPKLDRLDLGWNDIREINLSEVPTFRPLYLNIDGNPIRCTCSLLRDYVQLLDSANVTFATSYGQSLCCANTESKLANYPWGNDVAALRLYDSSALGCLTTD